jgi:ELWxxDGT repeat protein
MKKILLCLSAISLFTTAQVPAILKDINVGTGMSMTSGDMNAAQTINNTLLFFANDGSGKCMWQSQGLTTNTIKLIPTTTGSPITQATNYTMFKGRLMFRDGSAGNIWITDGTNGGTYKINSTSTYTINGGFMVNANKFYFLATSAAAGQELYIADTVIGSAAMVKDIRPGVASSNIQNMLADNSGGYYFSANDGVTGDELWHTDGTTANTNLIKDIVIGTGGSSSKPTAYTNNTLFFMANDGVNGSELWRSDGTTAGTTLLDQMTAGSASTILYHYTTYNNLFIYSNNPISLRQSDGLAINNTSITIAANRSLTHGGCGFPSFYQFGGSLYCFGTRPSTIIVGNLDSLILYKMTNTVSTLTSIKSFIYGLSGGGSGWGCMNFIGTFGGKFMAREYFTAATPAHVCIISDGTAAGSAQVGPPSAFYPEQNLTSTLPVFINNKWIMPKYTSSDEELYTIDYTTLAENLVKNINPTGSFIGPGANSWEQFIQHNNRAFFVANDGSTGYEPYVTDGTAAGTYMLLDINVGSTNGPDCTNEYNVSFKKAGNYIFFVADEGINGKEPWVINNTLTGINETEFTKANIQAYPNPFNNELKVRYTLTENNNEAIIKLIEPATGRLLMQQEVKDNKGTAKFNTEHLSAGIYLISVEQKGEAPVVIKVVNTK